MTEQKGSLWKEEILEQLALAKLLSEKSGFVSGRRISLILVDNVIEYILKLYCSKFADTELSRKQLEEVRRNFPQLIKFVRSKIRDQEINWDDLRRYHETRNTLYHEPFLPLTVNIDVIEKYMSIAIDLLRKLFNEIIEAEELDLRKSKINQILVSRKLDKPIIKVVKISEEQVKIVSRGEVTLKDAIKLVIYGFTSVVGKPPNNNELHKSLLVSGFQIDKKTLSVRLSEMRRNGVLRKGWNILTSKAVKGLGEKFFIETEAKDTLLGPDESYNN